MLTENVKSDLAFRLGPFVKYTISGGFFWNCELQRFVPTTKYNYYTWCASYYAGHSFQIGLAIYLIYANFCPEVSMEDYENSSVLNDSKSNQLLTFAGMGFWFVVTAILAVGSVAVEYRDEQALCINQAYILDSKLKTLFGTGYGSTSLIPKKWEVFVKVICYIPLILSIMFPVSFLHPNDPVHSMMEDLLEIPFEVCSLITWVWFLIEGWAVLGFIGIVVSTVITATVFIIIWEQVLTDLLPIRQNLPLLYSMESEFLETSLGFIHEDTIVAIYRTLQVSSGLVNVWMAKVRIAYHSVAILMIAIVTSYALITNSRTLIATGSADSFSLAGLLALGLIISTGEFYMECCVIDGMETRWTEFKKRLMQCRSRNSFVYKTALSFRSITLMTTYPFCNVNKTTFLEWCAVGMENLANLLLGV